MGLHQSSDIGSTLREGEQFVNAILFDEAMIHIMTRLDAL
jgi:hypothetical protein